MFSPKIGALGPASSPKAVVIPGDESGAFGVSSNHSFGELEQMLRAGEQQRQQEQEQLHHVQQQEEDRQQQYHEKRKWQQAAEAAEVMAAAEALLAERQEETKEEEEEEEEEEEAKAEEPEAEIDALAMLKRSHEWQSSHGIAKAPLDFDIKDAARVSSLPSASSLPV